MLSLLACVISLHFPHLETFCCYRVFVMKRKITILCFFCVLLQTASGLSTNATAPAKESGPSTVDLLNHGAKIESKYDGFNHETVLTLKKMRITCGAGKGLASTLNDTCVSFEASLHCPGVQLDYVRYARLQLIFETKNWDRRHPLGERDLFVVADGERFKLGTMALAKHDIDTTQLLEVMKEVLEVEVPYKTFNKIARAELVEVKVGQTTFALKDKNMAALRDLNNRVKF